MQTVWVNELRVKWGWTRLWDVPDGGRGWEGDKISERASFCVQLDVRRGRAYGTLLGGQVDGG